MLFSENTEVVIEGFPRSGNTFFVVAFLNLLRNKKINIAHHVHLTCQIKEALKNNIPVIVLIRDPIDAVVSLKIRDPKISINVAFTWYYFFYKFVSKKKNAYILSTLIVFTSDYSKITINEFEFNDSKKIKLENVFDRIEEINEDRFPVAFIKYEKMWDHQDEISDFVGFEIDLPPFKERKAKKKEDKNLLSSLEKTYSPFKNRVDNLNSYFTNKSLLKN